jgi:hypothetical protein
MVRRQNMQVYVQQSSMTTLPFSDFIDSGCEFAQPEIPLNSGAGAAGISCTAFSKEARDITVGL